MPDEFDDLIEETPPEPLDDVPVQEPERSSLADPEPSETRLPNEVTSEPMLGPLMRASDLLEEGEDDQGDFEPGGLYKGMRILAEHLWPADEWTPNHAMRFPHRFYVETPSGTPGLVPWPGSQIVWPWERGWSVDMNRVEVESFLKEPEKKAKK